MSTTIDQPFVEAEEKASTTYAIVFKTASDLLVAAQRLVDLGLSKWEVYTPYPLHEVDQIRQPSFNPLPYVVAFGALVGLTIGFLMPWYFNAVDYPLIISGKPMFAFEASLPVAFELAILLAAFGAFAGALAFAGLPKFHNPLLRSNVLSGATDDRFCLVLKEASHRDREMIEQCIEHADEVEVNSIELGRSSSVAYPDWLKWSLAVFAVLLLIPPALIAKARVATSDTPRIHLIQDMDFQPKFKAQQPTTIFRDGRAARPAIAGTLARGDLQEDVEYFRGVVTDDADPVDRKFVTSMPVDVDIEMLKRGRQRYEIFCATCHGVAGDGDGLVTARALELQQGTWVRPTSLHDERIVKQPVGELYHVIANGVRKMPAYSAQIPVEDRWAIVAYVKALQQTRLGSIENVPPSERPALRELQ